MREILFRGKAIRGYSDHYASGGPYISKGDWMYGNLMIEKQPCGCIRGCYIIRDTHRFEKIEVDPATVGQYTGLKDKNGVKIFEGDICKYRYGRWTYIGKVAFNTHACIFEMRRTEIVGYHGERAIKTQLLNHIDKVGVIGNIYDNPDLLEVED